jgi:DNA recombination-dependent growth factor C
MSFLSSNFNLCVFELPKEFSLKPAEIYDRLATKKFKEITALEKSCQGWVAIHNMFKSDFTYEETCAGSCIAAAFRQDVKKVSGKLVRKLYLERLAQRKKDGIKL